MVSRGGRAFWSARGGIGFWGGWCFSTPTGAEPLWLENGHFQGKIAGVGQRPKPTPAQKEVPSLGRHRMGVFNAGVGCLLLGDLVFVIWSFPVLPGTLCGSFTLPLSPTSRGSRCGVADRSGPGLGPSHGWPRLQPPEPGEPCRHLRAPRRRFPPGREDLRPHAPEPAAPTVLRVGLPEARTTPPPQKEKWCRCCM